jgi:hypothetical protein
LVFIGDAWLQANRFFGGTQEFAVSPFYSYETGDLGFYKGVKNVESSR